MKNLVKTILLISVFAITTSCSEDVTPATIIGKWKFSAFGSKTDLKDFQITYDDLIKDPEYKESGLTVEDFTTLTFEFLADSTAIIGGSKGKWSESKDKKVVTIKYKNEDGDEEVEVYKIIGLSDTQLNLSLFDPLTKKVGAESFSDEDDFEAFINELISSIAIGFKGTEKDYLDAKTLQGYWIYKK